MTKFSDMIEVRNEHGQLCIEVQMPTTEQLKVLQLMEDGSRYCEFINDGRKVWVYPTYPASSEGPAIIEFVDNHKLYPAQIIRTYRIKSK